jgi:hypothetical protein
MVLVAELGTENVLARESASAAISHLVFLTPKHKAQGLMNHHYCRTLSIRGISQDWWILHT